MELNPSNLSIPRHLPMHHVAVQLSAGNEYYTLDEKAFGHLVIRASFDDKKLRAAIKSVTGLKFPTKALSSMENKEYSINWISPDEVLLLVPEKTEFEVETKLRELMTGHFAIVNVTGGQTVLELSGERAETILKKSSSYDVSPSNFPIGKVVTTVFAKSQAVIRRTGDNSFQLIVRRSFNDYIWQWIVDAGHANEYRSVR